MNKWLLATLALVVSVLQAWDANALNAEPAIQLIIAMAVMLPAGAIVITPHAAVRLAAAGAAMAMLAMARVLSDTHMPELALAGGFAGILILVSQIWPERRRSAAKGV